MPGTACQRPARLDRFDEAVAFALALGTAPPFRILVAFLNARGRLEQIAVHEELSRPLLDLAVQAVGEDTGWPAVLVFTWEPVPLEPPEDRVHAFSRLRRLAAPTQVLDWLMIDEVNLRSLAFTLDPASAWRSRPRARRWRPSR